jgi:hypothetical protein
MEFHDSKIIGKLHFIKKTIWLGKSINQEFRIYSLCANFDNPKRLNGIPYARYYNPRLVYFLPHLSVMFIIKSC